MFSSESEMSDSDIDDIKHFDNFLYAKNNKYEWKDLEFNGLDKYTTYIFNDKVTYKNKEKYTLIARVISGEILLPKKDQCYNCKCE